MFNSLRKYIYNNVSVVKKVSEKASGFSNKIITESSKNTIDTVQNTHFPIRQTTGVIPTLDPSPRTYTIKYKTDSDGTKISAKDIDTKPFSLSDYITNEEYFKKTTIAEKNDYLIKQQKNDWQYIPDEVALITPAETFSNIRKKDGNKVSSKEYTNYNDLQKTGKIAKISNSINYYLTNSKENKIRYSLDKEGVMEMMSIAYGAVNVQAAVAKFVACPQVAAVELSLLFISKVALSEDTHNYTVGLLSAFNILKANPDLIKVSFSRLYGEGLVSSSAAWAVNLVLGIPAIPETVTYLAADKIPLVSNALILNGKATNHSTNRFFSFTKDAARTVYNGIGWIFGYKYSGTVEENRIPATDIILGNKDTETRNDKLKSLQKLFIENHTQLNPALIPQKEKGKLLLNIEKNGIFDEIADELIKNSPTLQDLENTKDSDNCYASKKQEQQILKTNLESLKERSVSSFASRLPKYSDEIVR